MIFNKLNREERRLLKELMTYEISQGVLNTYKYKTRHNKNNTYEFCKNKLIRNIILGVRKPSEKYKYSIVSEYGNLVITYNTRKKEITYIENRVGNFDFEVNSKKKEYLNRKLGLIQVKSRLSGLFRFKGLFSKKEAIK